jgi:hypothetical protein
LLQKLREIFPHRARSKRKKIPQRQQFPERKQILRKCLWLIPFTLAKKLLLTEQLRG